MAALPLGAHIESMEASPLVYMFTNKDTVAKRLYTDNNREFVKKITHVPARQVAQCRMDWTEASIALLRKEDREAFARVASTWQSQLGNAPSATCMFMVHVPIASATINFADEANGVHSREERYVLCSAPLTYTSVDHLAVQYEGYVVVPLKPSDVRNAIASSWTKLTALLKSLPPHQCDEQDVASSLWRVAAMRIITRAKTEQGLSDAEILDTAGKKARFVTVPHLGSPHIADV